MNFWKLKRIYNHIKAGSSESLQTLWSHITGFFSYSSCWETFPAVEPQHCRTGPILRPHAQDRGTQPTSDLQASSAEENKL